MRKIFLSALVLCFMSSLCYAAVGPTYMSASTVSFNTVGMIVTFNTVISKAIIINESATDDIHVTFTGLGWDEKGVAMGTYNLPRAQGVTASTVNPRQAAVKLGAGQSLTWEINTDKIGFIKRTSSIDSGNVQYIVSSDIKQP